MESRNLGISESRKSANYAQTFYDLEVYRKSFEVSLAVHKSSLNFPKIEQYALADQIRRASKSICANIAEGYAKQQSSKPEFKRFLVMALGSAHEMQVWTDYCTALDYIDKETGQLWSAEYGGIIRMLQALLSKL